MHPCYIYSINFHRKKKKKKKKKEEDEEHGNSVKIKITCITPVLRAFLDFFSDIIGASVSEPPLVDSTDALSR